MSTAARTTTTTARANSPTPPIPLNPIPASNHSTTSTSNPTAISNNPQKTKWQTLKGVLFSSGVVQTLIALIGLILTMLGIRWAVQSYNIALWTELKDFRDDCRAVSASGTTILSNACATALGKDLDPPPYTPSSYFGRLSKRTFDAIDAIQTHKSIYKTWILDVLSYLDGCRPDIALFLVTTLQWLRYRKHKFFIGVLFVNQYILWPFWCDGKHGTWRGAVTSTIDLCCCTFTITQTDQLYESKPDKVLLWLVGIIALISAAGLNEIPSISVAAMNELSNTYVFIMLWYGYCRSLYAFAVSCVITMISVRMLDSGWHKTWDGILGCIIVVLISRVIVFVCWDAIALAVDLCRLYGSQ